MDLNLILSAETLRLSPELHYSELSDGISVIKNLRTKTYLKVTSEQLAVLEQFGGGRTVPAVFDYAIRERICPRLGELFELILKAIDANILLQSGHEPPFVPPYNWRVTLRPSWLLRPLALLLLAGIVVSLARSTEFPRSVIDVAAGVGVLSVALSIGSVMAASLLAGSGGMVSRPRWRWAALPPHLEVETDDAIMFPLRSQFTIFLGRAAPLAVAVAVTIWYRPMWGLVPLIGLLIYLRPIFGGRVTELIRLISEAQLSDAEHRFIFPPNRRAAERWRLLSRALRQPKTWGVILYGVIWTLALIHVAALLTDSPPWTLAFWKANGLHISAGIGGALVALGIGYLGWEFFCLARERARAQRETFRQWYARWFGVRKLVVLESTKLSAMMRSSLLSTLPSVGRQRLSEMMVERRVGAWKPLPDQFGSDKTHFAVILSGKVALRRVLPDRSITAQVLMEGDVVGLHDLADPSSVVYELRTLTPVVLLDVERAAAKSLLERIDRELLTQRVLKVPFLRRMGLCQNWHLQAIERFAKLATLVDYAEGETIFREEEAVEDFYIIFQGTAHLTRRGRRQAVVRAGGFFGEIGLLQNSLSNSTIFAHRDTRCLCIPRLDFMRFVTHNHMVALQLERVSSARLGSPIFPLQESNFRQI